MQKLVNSRTNPNYDAVIQVRNKRAVWAENVPFFGGFLDGVKNFVTVWTLLDFSLLFLSSNLLKRVIAGCGWTFCCLLAYASSSSLCSLEMWMRAVTSVRRAGGGHRSKDGLPLSQSPVVLDLLLFFFLILLSPALRAEASPSLVAIKTASFLAQQLWLVHMDCTPLIYHLYRFRETRCQSRKQSVQKSIKKAYCRVNNHTVWCNQVMAYYSKILTSKKTELFNALQAELVLSSNCQPPPLTVNCQGSKLYLKIDLCLFF